MIAPASPCTHKCYKRFEGARRIRERWEAPQQFKHDWDPEGGRFTPDTRIEAHKDTRSRSERATEQKDPHRQNLMAKCSNRRGNLGEGSRDEENLPQII